MVQGGQRPEHHPPEARRQLAELAADGAATRLLGIDHVQLAMPSGIDAAAEAERFYAGVLGLEPIPKPDALAVRGGRWFRSHGVELHLGIEEPFRPARQAHPALLVDDLDGLVERIIYAGGEVRPDDAIPGVRRVHTDDPFGNRIELVEVKEPSPASFRVLAEESIFPITLVDRSGVIRWIGASVERFFGWDPAEMIGHSFARFIAPSSLAEVSEAFAAIDEAFEVAPWGGVGLRADLLHANGSVVACEVAAITTKRTGLPWHVVLIRRAGYERALDVAVEAMAEGAELGDVLGHLASALEQAIPGSVAAVADGWRAPGFAASAGGGVDLLLDEPASPWARALATGEDVFVDDVDEMPEPLASAVESWGLRSCWVHPVAVPGDAHPSAALIVWRSLPGPPARFTWGVVVRSGHLLRLTLQWHRSHRALEFAATHDPLTGLANRHALADRMETVTSHPDGGAALLFIDLDRFKPVNDRYGHLIGDRVLAEVADRLSAALRPGDLVARLGGDEFAVLCERLADDADVEIVADRLLEVFRDPFQPEEDTEVVRLSASIGLTDLGPDEAVEDVLARADLAMREAKAAGRGRWTRG